MYNYKIFQQIYQRKCPGMDDKVYVSVDDLVYAYL